MELIRRDPEYGADYLEASNMFKGLNNSMMTLIQVLTWDSIGKTYRVLINKRPELAIFFGAFMLLGSISLMNLVTAIMVESSLRQAKEDQEAKKAWETLKRKQMAP